MVEEKEDLLIDPFRIKVGLGNKYFSSYHRTLRSQVERGRMQAKLILVC